MFINLPNPINVTHVLPFHEYIQFLSPVPFKILLSNWFPNLIHTWKKKIDFFVYSHGKF